MLHYFATLIVSHHSMGSQIYFPLTDIRFSVTRGCEIWSAIHGYHLAFLLTVFQRYFFECKYYLSKLIIAKSEKELQCFKFCFRYFNYFTLKIRHVSIEVLAFLKQHMDKFGLLILYTWQPCCFCCFVYLTKHIEWWYYSGEN